ncbi:MAG: hypothetical protein Q4C49_11500 [Bacillota bacterium]|nr:hypothetical protein [Bacillota bacterium]
MKRLLNLVWISLILVGCAQINASDSVSTAIKEEETDYQLLEENYRKAIDESFAGINGNEKVLRMPDGSWLIGSCVVTDVEEEIVFGEYDSNFDENAISVDECKEIMLREYLEEIKK